MLHFVLLAGLCFAFWQADWHSARGQSTQILSEKGDWWVAPGRPHQDHCPAVQEEEKAADISKLAELQLWPSKTISEAKGIRWESLLLDLLIPLGKQKSFQIMQDLFYILR